nr:IS1182 family transposase [Lactiplantibacillus plantarum]
KQVSPNPAKQQRRTVKSQKRKLDKRRDKMREHQAQQAIYGQRTVLIPYGTMLKENSRKWQSDDRKVMNWDYHEKDDYFINPQNV